jgi:hypothetical protein
MLFSSPCSEDKEWVQDFKGDREDLLALVAALGWILKVTMTILSPVQKI